MRTSVSSMQQLNLSTYTHFFVKDPVKREALRDADSDGSAA